VNIVAEYWDFSTHFGEEKVHVKASASVSALRKTRAPKPKHDGAAAADLVQATRARFALRIRQKQSYRRTLVTISVILLLYIVWLTVLSFININAPSHDKVGGPDPGPKA
jgi:hypothetical protein